MITHVPPQMGKTSALDPADLVHHSRLVQDPAGFDPAYLITSNFEAIARGPLLKGITGGSIYGRLFEICWWNALVRYGVDPSRIERSIDPSRGKHADIDLLVHVNGHDVALLLKTSLRERWKQMDRDAGAIRAFNDSGRRREIWAVFYREQRDDTAERMIRHARDIESQFFTGGVHVRTVLDGNAMRVLFVLCGANVAELDSATLAGVGL